MIHRQQANGYQILDKRYIYFINRRDIDIKQTDIRQLDIKQNIKRQRAYKFSNQRDIDKTKTNIIQMEKIHIQKHF